MKNYYLLAVIIIFAVIIIYFIIPKKSFENDNTKIDRDFTQEEQALIANQTFNSSQLAKFNGENGGLAYIAINGVVYDVTEKFQNGKHHGVQAGTDATDSFIKSPHAKQILEKLTIVGKFIEEEEKES